MTRSRLAVALIAVSVVACADEGPVSGPGTMTATLVSPNGAEGAASIVLLAGDVGAVTPVGETDVYSYTGSGSTQVVLINQTGGELSFMVAVADTTQPPAFVVQEVAAPDDQLRSSVDEYRLEYLR